MQLEERLARRRVRGCSSARRGRARGSRWRARARSRRAAAPPASARRPARRARCRGGRAAASAASAVSRIRSRSTIASGRTAPPRTGSTPSTMFSITREVRRERQLLVDHRDAGAARRERIARRVRGAVEPHLARVGRQRAGENRHQRALAGAVLADERADLAAAHREIDAVERDGRAERLARRRASRIAARSRLQPFRQVRVQQLLRVGVVHLLARDQRARRCRCAARPAAPFRCATIVFTPR